MESQPAAAPRLVAGFGIGPNGAPDTTPDPLAARAAAQTWVRGGLVGLPTETVYGLAGDACNPLAVARIYQVKGRPTGHPLIVHVASPAALPAWSPGATQRVLRFVERFWPGPLSVVLPRSSRAGDHITGGQDTVALRCPAHPVALACLRAFGMLTGDPAVGIAAPSANRFGRVSPTSAADVMAELAGRLGAGDLVIDGGRSSVGVESTIVDLTGPRPRVLRPGAVGRDEIDSAWADGSGRPEQGAVAVRTAPIRAPGMLESHYAPSARVLVVEARALPGLVGALAREPGPVAFLAAVGVPDVPGWMRLGYPVDSAEYARILYGVLREADSRGAAALVVVLPAGDDPLTLAVRDRLSRAAAGSQG